MQKIYLLCKMKEIDKIVRAYRATDWTQERAALGTVVKIEGSAYRRIGARMYVSSRGQWTGGISGGCLEGDALRRAQSAINSRRSALVVYDTLDEDSHQIGIGLGCNGRLEVLFTPIQPGAPDDPLPFLESILASRVPQLLLQVLRTTDPDDATVGRIFPATSLPELVAVSGISAATLDAAIADAWLEQQSRVTSLETASGARLEVLIEVIRPRIKLICVGDNYDVNAFVRIAHELAWEVHVAGKVRKLNREIFELATTVRPAEEAAAIELDAHTAIVLMAHDYRTDLQALRHFLTQDIPYVGLLGPRKRTLKMQRELAEAGVEYDLMSRSNIYAPVGLDIGAETPEEIALAIAAEIIAVLRRRGGGSLRERPGPIH